MLLEMSTRGPQGIDEHLACKARFNFLMRPWLYKARFNFGGFSSRGLWEPEFVLCRLLLNQIQSNITHAHVYFTCMYIVVVDVVVDCVVVDFYV